MQAHDMDEVIALMNGVVAGYRDRRSPRALFAAMYRRVTLRVQSAIAGGAFVDGPRMDGLATEFANRYFAALEAIEHDRRLARAWQIAFDAEARSHTMILQHLLLGMNAHINFDLPIAALAVTKDGNLADLESDFYAITGVLVELLDPVQAVVNRFSPLLDVLDRVGGRTDETIVTFSISNAREEAWHEANRLAGEPPVLRERSLLSLDRRVALLAERIILPGGPCGLATDLIARTEVADIPVIVDALTAIP
ncbi:MAG TPA: DUF5995 family protein [Polyangiaceae bacterium]|nr:DUF5995 family protein [Polyangiaceae bacterium]